MPALAFPEAGQWWLAYVGFVPLLLLVASAGSAREAGTRAWLGGSGFFLAVHHWLLPKVGPFALPLAALLGVLWLPWGRLAWRLLGPPSSAARLLLAMTVVPSAWVVTEVVRSWEHLGGPWALLGTSQWANRPTLGLAAVTGVWGLGFTAMAVNVAVTSAVRRATPAPARAGAAVAALAVLGATLAVGALASPPPGGRRVVVAGVQPGVIHGPDARLRAHEAATGDLARHRPDLVLWGESSVGFDPASSPGQLDRVAAAARAAGSDVLVNVDARRGGGGIFKTSLLVGPDGPRGAYDKMRLVPFGEYVPLRTVLGWVSGVTEAAAEDRRRGGSLTVLSSGPVRVGPLVCFESAFPDLPRELAARGAELIVVQAATTTFQGTWAQAQHASLAAVRAVESGRPVVHAAVSGVSAVFDATGRRLAWVEAGRRGVYVVAVPLSDGGTTPYARWGEWLPTACAALLVGRLLGRGLRRFSGSRRSSGSRSAGPLTRATAASRDGTAARR